MTPADLDVRHHYATVHGLRMHFVEAGAESPPDASSASPGGPGIDSGVGQTGAKRERPLVVLLHGFPEMWWSWRYQIPALVRAGYRVVAPDLRGYNDTEAKGPYDIDTLRDDVVGLLDHLGADKAIVVAHDWGGGIAWHLAGTRQDRCSALVVMNCPHPIIFTDALFTKRRQLLKSWYMFFFQLPLLPEMSLTRGRGAGAVAALTSMAVDKTNFGAAELAPFAEAVCKPGRATAMLGWYRAAIRAGLRAGREGVASVRNYDRIAIPTLLIWAMEDRALGYEDVVPGTERFVPGIEIRTIPACGHFVQQERPQRVNELMLDFLGRSAPSGSAPIA